MKDYLKTWFIIDLLSIIPFELIIIWFYDEPEETSSVHMNKFVRIARISKLYKLAKLSKLMKLMRMFKLMKSKKKISDKVSKMVKHGAALDRLCFFIMIMILMSHFIGCMWIYIATVF